MTERLLPSFAKARFPGNALTEYALIGVAILSVSFAMLGMIGNTLNGSMSDLHRDMSHHETLVRAEMAEVNAAEAARLRNLENILTTAEAKLLQQSVADKVQTAGANGSTQVLAKQLRLLAQKLLNEGKISQDQYDLLMKLSNQGYRIARVEAMVEEGIRYAKGDIGVFAETKYKLDDEEISAQMLARLVGFEGVTPTTADAFLNDKTFAQPEMNGLLLLFRQVQDAGIMNDPLVKSTVESAVIQIAQIAESMEHTIYMGVKDSELPTDTSVLNGKIASVTTSMSSERICKAGNFTSDGVECTAN